MGALGRADGKPSRLTAAPRGGSAMLRGSNARHGSLPFTLPIIAARGREVKSMSQKNAVGKTVGIFHFFCGKVTERKNQKESARIRRTAGSGRIGQKTAIPALFATSLSKNVHCAAAATLIPAPPSPRDATRTPPTVPRKSAKRRKPSFLTENPGSLFRSICCRREVYIPSVPDFLRSSSTIPAA